MRPPLRILFLADSHLGIDTPLHARVQRRRRGDDFLANYRTALAPALAGEADVVIHGGDVFDHPRVPASLAYQAFQPLVRIAQRGIPVFIVAGNHERSCLPHVHLVRHPNVHIFDAARTFVIEKRGIRLALTGFPYERQSVRSQLPTLLAESGWQQQRADVRLLCMHQCVEGATVGPHNFTFTGARDVVRHADVPRDFTAVLSGHIHRHQVLTRDLRKRDLAVPVLYPGSIERTALAEMHERKGYMMLNVVMAEDRARLDWEFHELYARPMIVHRVHAQGLPARLTQMIEQAPADAIVTIYVDGELAPADRPLVSAARVRTIAPATMNVEIRAASRRPVQRTLLRASPHP